jgi:hypothetical protein
MKDKIIVTANKLQLADKVLDVDHPEIGVLTVMKISEKGVRFHRPYTSCADFSCTSGVICYIGVEEFEDFNYVTDYQLIERRTLK